MKQFRNIAFVLISFLIAGCASLRPQNTPLIKLQGPSLLQRDHGEAFVFLSFSGGGTRAAALAYGVLEELRDTRIKVDGRTIRLLDEVDYISAVSGGSFTAAYYGVYGDRIFTDFAKVFLKQNVQKNLILGLFNPVHWIRSLLRGFNRTEAAIEYFDKHIFNGATFADILRSDVPTILINATDLSTGHRFGFTRTQFELICSDLSRLKVARAVAASSAVPVLFAPVVLRNFAGEYRAELPEWLEHLTEADEYSTRKKEILDCWRSYLDSNKRPYIHLIDGGIADNLGLRAIMDGVILLGGARRAAAKTGTPIPKKVVVILVNAQREPERPIDLSPKPPPLSQLVSAVTHAQISRYNVETIALLQESMQRWATELSIAAGRVVEVHFIEVNFAGIKSTEHRSYFNRIGTSLALSEEEVEKLREAGRTLLRESQEFEKLLHQLQ